MPQLAYHEKPRSARERGKPIFKRSNRPLIRVLIALPFLLILLLSTSGGFALAQKDSDCIKCHQDREKCGTKVKIDPVSGEINIVSMLMSDADVNTYKASGHGGKDFTCVDCHADLEGVEGDHQPDLKPVDCITFCHDDPAADYLEGSHVKAMKDKDKTPFTCKDCHTGEKSRRDVPRAENPIGRGIMIEKCSSCHEPHANSYRINLHGQLTALGYTGTDIASCPDCHGKHTILNSTDPDSTVGESNIVQTCGKCHAGSSPRFARHIEHPQFKNIEQYKSLFLAFKDVKSQPQAIGKIARDPQTYLILGFAVYMAILVVTFSTFGLHSLLIWFRTILNEFKGKESEKHEK